MSPRDRKTIKTRIDVMIDGVGRFCKRSGATTIAEHRARLALLQRLIEADQLDVIRALQNDEITWAELRQAERKKRLHSDALAADIALSRRLWDQGEEPNVVQGALSLTLQRMGNTDSTRERYDVAFGQLKAKAADFLPAAAIVKDLGAVPWKDAFACMAGLSPASRNRVRSALSAFLSVFLGDKFHPFRREVMKGMGRMEDEKTAPREITIGEFWKLLEKMDDAVKPSFITLAATGMRIGEYLQCDASSIRRLPVIQILESKTGHREASIAPALQPFVLQAIPCRIAPAPKVWRGVQYDARYKKLYKAMAAASEATGIDCSPHFLRHLYAQVGTDKLPSALVQQGLGHATASMTDKYARRRSTARVSTAVGNALVRGRGVRGKVRKTSRRGAS